MKNMPINHLEIKNIQVTIEESRVINQLSFDLALGDIACLLGPSGCGKTTILRSIAGLQHLSGGTIHLNKNIISDHHYTLATEKREVGMMFQDFALFPHLNVAENICFGIKKMIKPQREARLNELLALIDLQHIAKRYPHELSGGQQQRVALARAIAPRPAILLLDEPFSSIDSELRPQLARQIKQVIKTEGISALMVTHDQHEAFAIADHIGVINNGQLLQWDSAYQLYHCPNSRFVANFIGHGSFIKGTRINQQELNTVFGNIPLTTNNNTAVDHYDVLIRPDDIIHDDDSTLLATVVSKQFLGAEFLYELALSNNERVLCYTPSHHNHAIGEAIGIQVDIEHVVYFSNDEFS